MARAPFKECVGIVGSYRYPSAPTAGAFKPKQLKKPADFLLAIKA
jgi:hypothetical protein